MDDPLLLARWPAVHGPSAPVESLSTTVTRHVDEPFTFGMGMRIRRLAVEYT